MMKLLPLLIFCGGFTETEGAGGGGGFRLTSVQRMN